MTDINTDTYSGKFQGPNSLKMHPFSRFAVTLTPAAGITFGLFLIMSGLIAVDFQPAEASEARPIGVITPQMKDDLELKHAPKPVKLIFSNAPPPPPVLSNSKVDINLPIITLSGEPTKAIVFADVQPINLHITAIENADARPIREPVATYPWRALQNGLEGNCSVQFNVDVRGQPYNLQADCTHAIFRAEAIRAVSKTEFVPKLENGRPVERKNVIYPLEFSLK